MRGVDKDVKKGDGGGGCGVVVVVGDGISCQYGKEKAFY